MSAGKTLDALLSSDWLIDWDTVLLRIERRMTYLSLVFTCVVVSLFGIIYSSLITSKGPFILLIALMLTPFLSYVYGKVVRMDTSRAFKNSYFLGIDVFLKDFFLSLIINSWLIAFSIAYYINIEDFIAFASLLIVFALLYAFMGSIRFPVFKPLTKAKNAILNNNNLIMESIVDKLNNLKSACFVDDIELFLEDFVVNRKNNTYKSLHILKIMSEIKKRELACSLINERASTKSQKKLKKKIDSSYINTIGILTELSEKANIEQLIQLLKSELKNILMDVCAGVLVDTQLLSEKVEGIYNDLKYLAPLNKISSFVDSYTLHYYLQKTQIKDLFHAFSMLRKVTNFSPDKLRRFACRTAELLFRYT